MKVGIRLQAILRKRRPAGFQGDVVEPELAGQATVRDAIQAVGVPENLVHAVFVNDQRVTLDIALALGDIVRVFPPVAGG